MNKTRKRTRRKVVPQIENKVKKPRIEEDNKELSNSSAPLINVKEKGEVLKIESKDSNNKNETLKGKEEKEDEKEEEKLEEKEEKVEKLKKKEEKEEIVEKKELPPEIEENINNIQNLKILLKNRFITSWIDESSLNILKEIKSNEVLNKFLTKKSKNTFINIKSNFIKGTTEVANFPNEIIKFFGKISILNTNGSRKTLISLIKKFDTKYLKIFEMNGKIYSPTKKVFPLKLENIQKGEYEIFSLVNGFDPNIDNLKIQNLYINSVKFINPQENVFKNLKSISFLFCEFYDEFEFIKMFHKSGKENLISLNFETCNLPVLKNEDEKSFENLKSLCFSNIDEFSFELFQKYLNLSENLESVKLKDIIFEDIEEINNSFCNCPKLRTLQFINISSEKFKRLNLNDFSSLKKLKISGCGYKTLKGIDKFKGLILLDKEYQKKYESLAGFKKFYANGGKAKFI